MRVLRVLGGGAAASTEPGEEKPTTTVMIADDQVCASGVDAYSGTACPDPGGCSARGLAAGISGALDQEPGD